MTRGKAPDGSIQRFEYDESGRLVKIKTDAGVLLEEYTYGASRQRLRKTVANGDKTYYAWGGSSALVEYSEASSASALSWAKSYIYAGSRLLSTITKSGTSEVTEYHHPDRLGTKLITNTVANTAKEQATLPFGTSIDAETQATSNQRFASYDRSESTGLDYAVNRTYNSGQSRFTQVDPIGMASASIGNPQSMNLFAYTENNPINFTDSLELGREAVPREGDKDKEVCIINDKGEQECTVDVYTEEAERAAEEAEERYFDHLRFLRNSLERRRQRPEPPEESSFDLQELVDDAATEAVKRAKSNKCNTYLESLGVNKGSETLSKIDKKRQIKFRPNTPGRTDTWIAYAVISENDAFNKADGGIYKVGETILISEIFAADNIAGRILYDKPPNKSLDRKNARALILLHELVHIGTKRGHGAIISDGKLNSEILRWSN